MATTGRMHGVMRRLWRSALAEAPMSDGDLLERYLARRDESAFAALVERHGAMVLGVCRRVLGHAHDADDAFQATFLVLVRKASSIRPRERVGPWLYGVAVRTALKAKAMNLRRRAKQQSLADVPGPAPPAHADWIALLDQEVQRLPDKYRLPIVLCDLEGKTRKQAARQLGWPEGTVATRLQHGRALVHKRLARHGLPVAAGAVPFVWSQAVSASSVAAPLAASTIKAASLFASGNAAGLIPLNILALAQGVLQAMVLQQVKNVSAVIVVLLALGVGLSSFGAGVQPEANAQAPPAARTPAAPTVESKPAENSSGRLPTGPAPVQVLVSYVNGKVAIRTTQAPVYRPRTVIDPDGVSHTFYEVSFTLRTDRYERSEIEVYDTHRRKLDTRDLPKWLKEEIPALLVVGGREIDPLHLRLIKEGTLIFAVPPTNAPAPATRLIPQTTQTGPPAGTSEIPLQPPTPQTVPTVEGVPPTTPTAPVGTPPQPTPLTDPKQPPEIRNDDAERDLAIAEFYLKIGKRASATFYYERICRRYAGTPHAQRAAQLLKELPPNAPQPNAPAGKATRIGEIIIKGNRRVADSVIRDRIALYPGQILKYQDVRAAEEKLRAMKEFVNASPVVSLRPTVTVLDSEGEFKDILVEVQETLRLDVLDALEKFEGTWKVTSTSVDGKPIPGMFEAEFDFAGDRVTFRTRDASTRHVLTIEPETKKFTLKPAEDRSDAKLSQGIYELTSDSLQLTLQTGSSPAMQMKLKRKPMTTGTTAASRNDVPPSDVLIRQFSEDAARARVVFASQSKGLTIAAESVAFGPDGRVKFTDCKIVRQTKNAQGQLGEPEYISGKHIYLKLDSPVRSVEDIANRRIISIEIDGALKLSHPN